MMMISSSCYFVEILWVDLNMICMHRVVQVARKMDLVYGGGSLGLMGEVSEAVHSAGGHVIGSVRTSIRSSLHALSILLRSISSLYLPFCRQ